MKNHKNKEEGILGRPRAFAATKGYLATTKQNGQNGHPRVRCSKAVLRRGKDTVQKGQNFYFVSESPLFVHR